MTEEQIPTFLVDGEEIVDVLFTTWTEESFEAWKLSENSETFKIGHRFDRVIFELPIGCFEMSMRLDKGDTITFHTTPTIGGAAERLVRPCRRPRGYVQEEVQDDEVPRYQGSVDG